MRTNPVLWKRSYWISSIVLLAFAVVLALPCTARADNLTVNCAQGGTYDSIQAAVDALPAPPPGQWNTISIQGPCNESVSISGQHRLWLGTSLCGDNNCTSRRPSVQITGDGSVPVLTITGSQDVTIENLILTGGDTGLSVVGGSSVTGNIIKAEGNTFAGIAVGGLSSLSIYDGHAVGNGQNGIYTSGGSYLTLDGNTPWFPEPRPFLISGNGGTNFTDGGIWSGGNLEIGGGVTIENNSNFGIAGAGGGEYVIGAWHGENLIQNNPIGVSCREGASCVTYGPNTVKNSDIVGVQVTEGSTAQFFDAIIEGNGGAGVEVTVHSSALFGGQNKIRNNGSTFEPQRAGIRVDGTSQLSLFGTTEVMGNTGPGIVADINSSLDVTDTTISGNSEEGIRVRHMSVAEIQGATTIGGNHGGPVTCDSRSLVITNLIPSTPRCANIEGAPGGPKPRSASAMRTAPNVAEMMQKARQMAERFKQRK